MKSPLIIAGLLLASVFATPDCYDYSVTTEVSNYLEVLPILLYFDKVDWMMLEPNQ